MGNPKFEMGDRVENTKTRQTGLVKTYRGKGLYMVSVRGFGEQQWNEAEMEKSKESKTKWNHTWNRSM